MMKMELDALGLFSVATSSAPATFEPTSSRGAVAVVPSTLPSSPTTGTLAVDENDSNMLKWWDGDEWISCSSEVISGGGGSGIGAGQTINLQQGLPANVTIASSGVLVSIVANDTLPTGLVLNESTGQITGTPEVFGNFTVSLTATFSDATVATDDVGFAIAEAFAITFTFDESPLLSIPEGVYVNNFEFTYTPYPNALPTTWDIQGLPDGMSSWVYGTNNGTCVIYGEPQYEGTYEITVNATNWTGTTTKIFSITVYPYNVEVFGTSTFDGIYAYVDFAYYTYNYSGNYVELVYGSPASWSYPVRYYENQNDTNIKIFFYEPYASWILADTSSFDGTPPLYVAPMGNSYESAILPPKTNWYNPETMYVDWVQPI